PKLDAASGMDNNGSESRATSFITVFMSILCHRVDTFRQGLERELFLKSLLALLNHPPLCIHGRHTAGSGSRNRLAVIVILNVSAGKNTFNTGLGAARHRFDVAVGVQLEYPIHQLRVGRMPDR